MAQSCREKISVIYIVIKPIYKLIFNVDKLLIEKYIYTPRKLLLY